MTVTGERPIEDLRQGDLVVTVSGDEKTVLPVKWIGQRRLDLTAHPRPETVAPVCIKRSAFADNVPHRDLRVSPNHGILVDGMLICARQLINGATIQQEQGGASIEYFHVELDTHSILLAEGLTAESYLNTGNDGFFANAGAPLTLHPDLTDKTDYPTREEASVAPFVCDEENVRPIWQRLADRANALGKELPQVDVTSDPDLRILANGTYQRPLQSENGIFSFALPAGTAMVQLISRASKPNQARPWLSDDRMLGVSLERIILRSGSDVLEVPLDHPDLSQGWGSLERVGRSLHRWTDGKAILPLPETRGAIMLEIRASTGGMKYILAPTKTLRAA
jgi:hypothetical protein